MRPEEANPLVPRGFGGPKFPEDVQNKFLANEDENAYVQLEVFGDPAPTAQWFRVSSQDDWDLSESDRYKFWTDGTNGSVFLGVEKCTKADEGIYRCVISNRFGRREHKFKLFISRSFARKAPLKREVQVYWSESPKAKFVKQGEVDQVSFTAKLTVSDKKVKWSFQDVVCEEGEKYSMVGSNGTFTITIKKPEASDTGRYKCVLANLEEISCETYLDVQPPDPVYSFLKLLPPVLKGFSGRPLELRCLCAEAAEVAWSIDGKEINEDDEQYATSSCDGEQLLEIVQPLVSDTATFSCRILKFGKEGEEETACDVQITEFLHKFSKPLVTQLYMVERETLSLMARTEEEFAIVRWFHNDKELVVERKRNQRMKLNTSGTLHLFCLERSKVADSGTYTARTNSDQTSCEVFIEEYPYRLQWRLPPQTEVNEGGRAEFEVEVEEEEADVRWFSDDVEIHPEKSRTAKITAYAEGKKRSLVIRKCDVEDSARITARTNVDETGTIFMVKCQNEFLQRLPEKAACNEHCTIDFTVKVKDRTAPVHFFLNKCPIDRTCHRYEFLNDGKGVHVFRILKVTKNDSGVISCKTPTNRSTDDEISRCIFDVNEGETPPLIGKVEPVSCVAILHSYSERMNSYIQKEACRIVVPYKIQGTAVSTLDILVEKDGKELEIGGGDIEMKVRSDRVTIDIGNPIRTSSGMYKLTLSNDQGSAEVLVPVEVVDVPSPPMEVTVSDVRKDSLVVNWRPPRDSGGTPIKHYIVEIIDFSTNNMWMSVGMTEDGEASDLTIQHLQEGHRYNVRVTAANRVGQSDPQEMQNGVDVVTKDPWDVPSQPSKPAILDWTPTFVDLSWMPPDKDGGSPITAYIIEARETSMQAWLENIIVDLKDLEVIDGGALKGRCENLHEEYQYRFRIIAVNRAGKSLHGPSSENVTAMHKNIPPFIKGDGLTDFNMKFDGKPFRFDIWVGGEPVPSIEWFRNDVKVVNDGSTNVNVYTKSSSAYTLKNAVLSVPKALEGQHDGLYKLRLKNESGVFEAVANVKIDGDVGRRKKEEEEKKARLAQEQKEQEEREKVEKAMKEERERVEKEMQELERLNFINNRKLSMLSKDEDKDSGMKIGEDSVEGSEYEEYTETEEDEDFYEGEEADIQTEDPTDDKSSQDILDNKSSHSLTNGDKEVEEAVATKLGGEVAEDAGERRTSDYNGSCDSHGSAAEDESRENGSSADKFEENAAWENARNVSNRGSMQGGAEVGENNYSDDETSLEGKTCENENTAEIIGKIPFDNKERDADFTETKDATICDSNMIGNAENWPEDSVQECPVYENPYQVNTAGMGWYDSPEESNGANEAENWAEGSGQDLPAYENPYQVSTAGMGWYDSAEDNYDADEANGGLYKGQTEDDYKENDNSQALEEDHNIPIVVEEEAEPEPVFDPVEHMASLQEQLDGHLASQGFLKSDTVVQPQLVSGGDGCLVSLLDQMNQEGQDFKVWERDDFSFLRWYVTKQMESLMTKVEVTNFVEAIEGDVQQYIDRVSDDGVHLDKTFLLAVATIFNKDIVLVGHDGEKEVIEGGIDGRRGKGIPLYLGHIRGQQGKNKDIFISILPDGKHVQDGDLQDKVEEEQTVECTDVDHLVAEEVDVVGVAARFEGKWKRMDSYNPRDSKDMEQLIEDIEATEGYAEIEEEVTGSKDQDNGNEDYPVYHNTYQVRTEGMGWYDSSENSNCDNQDQASGDVIAQDCPVYENPYQTSTAGMGWYDSAEESKCDSSQSYQHSDQPDQHDAASDHPVYENPYMVNTEGMGWFDSTGEDNCDNDEVELKQDELPMDPVAEEGEECDLVVDHDVVEEEEEDCEGWVYDSNTGYWIRSEEAATEDEQLVSELEVSQNPEVLVISEQIADPVCAPLEQDQQDGTSEQGDSTSNIQLNVVDSVSETKPDELRQDSVTEKEADSVQKLDPEKEEEAGWSNEWAEYAEVQEEVEEDDDIEDIEEASRKENEANKECPEQVEQTADVNAFASENSVTVEEMSPHTANPNETRLEDNSECGLSDPMTNEDSCTQHDTALDLKEATGSEKTTADTEKQATRIVRKIKIKAKVNEDKAGDQVDPCADPVVASEPTTLSVCPADTTTADTHTLYNTDPAITESVSGVSQAALEFSVPAEKAENAEEGGGKQRGPEEAKCETVPVVCVDLVDKEPLSNEDFVNGDGPCGQVGGTRTVTTPDGKTAEVKMRAPSRKYSGKKTASYRWSGTEMFQLEGERTSMCPSPVPESPLVNRKDLEATRAGIAYKKTLTKLNKKLNNLGFSISSTWDKEYARSGDNCVRALIDQICQPWQDFKVWDREDHGFLRWYLAKQIEIQVAGGRQDHFLRGRAKDEPKAFIEKMGQDEEYVNNDFLFSTARVLNKDIFVVESPGCEENMVVFRGGPQGGPGKGPALLLSHLSSEEAGKDYYQSLVSSTNSDPTSELRALPVLEQS